MNNELSSPFQNDENKSINTDTKVSVKQQAKNDALELANLLYDIYTKERDNARVINGQNNDIIL